MNRNQLRFCFQTVLKLTRTAQDQDRPTRRQARNSSKKLVT